MICFPASLAGQEREEGASEPGMQEKQEGALEPRMQGGTSEPVRAGAGMQA